MAPIEVMAANDGDPLGVVAHADGDPVALLHAVALDEHAGDGVDLGHDVGEVEPLVLVDEERALAGPGQVEQRSQRRQGVLVDLRRPTQHLGLDHREHLARRGDRGHRLVEAHRHLRALLVANAGDRRTMRPASPSPGRAPTAASTVAA